MLHKETVPGQVPYRTLLPKGIDNLLVPVCLSSTHVAWGSIRLEPTWMNIAESAGFAAAMAIEQKKTPAEIDPYALLGKLAEARVMLTLFNDVDLASREPWVAAVQYFGAQGFFSSYDARPRDPLTADLAAAWAKSAARWSTDSRYDATENAAAQRRLDSAKGTVITAGEFVGLLAAALSAEALSEERGTNVLKTLNLKASQPPSRGDACRVLWHTCPVPIGQPRDEVPLRPR